MPPFIYPKVPKIESKGKLLIVPVVSTANVGQLAVDLLITSFSLEYLAILDPEYFVPVASGREDGKDGITTPYELYGRQDLDFMIIQQRSPVLKSKKQDFVSNLLGWIDNAGFGSVLFLSGMDLTNRTDAQMFTPTYQLVPSISTPSLSSTPLKSLAELPIPHYTSPVSQFPNELKSEQDTSIPFIPGGGITRRILSSLLPSWNVPTASLLHFVVEGDNRGDARLFAAVTAKVIGHELQQWREPTSWKQGLFGAPHDQTLYG